MLTLEHGAAPSNKNNRVYNLQVRGAGRTRDLRNGEDTSARPVDVQGEPTVLSGLGSGT